jgi:hypothetical protein
MSGNEEPGGPGVGDDGADMPGFTGYKWTVEAISYDGTATPVPAQYSVCLQFTPDGHFAAKEPVNFHSGSYTLAPGGFRTGKLAKTMKGYAGSDPVVLLAQKAIGALGSHSRAHATLRGDTLTVTVNGYTLIAQRAGAQANWPAPRET